MKLDDTPSPSSSTATLSTTTDSEKGSSTIYDDIVEKEDYSVFTVNQKRAIIVTASFAAWFRYDAELSTIKRRPLIIPSPLSGIIYYPATTQISSELGVPVSKINITVTTYLVSTIWQQHRSWNSNR